MASEVEICNLALGNIRASSINSLNEASLQAQVCRARYPILRDQLLQDAPWQFARRIKPLSLLADEQLFTWSYVYQYPSDCILITRLIPEYEQAIVNDSGEPLVSTFRHRELHASRADMRAQIPYEVFNNGSSRVIGTDLNNARIEYQAKVEDPNLFSPQFTMALSHLLASEIAVPLVGAEGGMKYQQRSLQLYEKYTDAARSNDANEQFVGEYQSEFITIRS